MQTISFTQSSRGLRGRQEITEAKLQNAVLAVVQGAMRYILRYQTISS